MPPIIGPRFGNPQSAGVLSRLQSLSNLTPTGDSFVDKRRQQMASGEDTLAPSELEQRLTQEQLGGGFSRDMIRDSGIQNRLRELAAIRAKAEADIAPEVVKGQFGIQAAEIGARTAADRAAANQEAQDRRMEQQQMNMLERLGLTGQQAADRQQTALTTPKVAASRGPQTATLTALQKARDAAPTNFITKFLRGGSSQQQIKGALENVLAQSGTLAGVSQFAEAVKRGEPLQPEDLEWAQSLGPHEKEYLKLVTGQDQ